MILDVPPRQGEGVDAVEEELQSLAVDALEQQPTQLLGNEPETGGDDSERPSTAASLVLDSETQLVTHSVSTRALAKDCAVTPPVTEIPDLPAVATSASASPTHPLYCLY